MNILHVAAHLGGGVGKAHAALAESRAEAGEPERHIFALIEAPRDLTYVDRIVAAGDEVRVATPEQIRELVAAADVVQVEWWNHPRLYDLLARTPLPAMRLVLWTHISGLAPPFLPALLPSRADRTFFTSPCSFAAPNLQAAVAARPDAFAVANSGFGFAPAAARGGTGPVRCGYLGTLDFIKMHPGVFDVIDAVPGDLRVSFFGQLDPVGEVAARAAAMRHPERVRFEGYASDPQRVLGALDLFLYLLAPGHYGTAENALVEAMSVGAAPLVWANPAETHIVRDGETGFVVDDLSVCAGRLAWALDHPREVGQVGARAADAMARSHTPAATLATFRTAYAAVAARPREPRDFAGALGADARAWFLSTLDPGGGEPPPGARLLAGSSSKGSLGHFRDCFPDDPGLAALAALAR
ncbi:hypothetical protein V5F53_10075 [Xanthobacter sp. V4C-4]|uniref:glycosyltransferase n=1 Tax=Xanthobacter cornucopiae TaxID=3119924 RepID=UPI00372B9229